MAEFISLNFSQKKKKSYLGRELVDLEAKFIRCQIHPAEYLVALCGPTLGLRPLPDIFLGPKLRAGLTGAGLLGLDPVELELVEVNLAGVVSVHLRQDLVGFLLGHFLALPSSRVSEHTDRSQTIGRKRAGWSAYQLCACRFAPGVGASAFSVFELTVQTALRTKRGRRTSLSEMLHSSELSIFPD